MNLLCVLFGINCVTGKSTRVSFTSTSGVGTDSNEFNQLPEEVQKMLRGLNSEDIGRLTDDQLEQVLEALTHNNAQRAAQLLTVYMLGRSDQRTRSNPDAITV